VTTMTNPCERFAEDLAAVIDGDTAALEVHLDHLSECDACRDARHEAAALAAGLDAAGADYRVPADLESRVLAAIEAEPRQPHPVPVRSAIAEPVEASTPPLARERGKDGERTPASRYGRRRRVMAWSAGAVALAAAGLAMVSMRGGDGGETGASADAGLTATLERTARAGDGAGGVTVETATGEVLTAGAGIPAGATIRTDERTRARLALSDGTTLTLDHLTEVALGSGRRFAATGQLVIETAPAAAPLIIDTPTGAVEVTGTRLALSATGDTTSVRVTRGRVVLGGVEVGPGQEASLARGAEPVVAPAIDLAASVAWAELAEGIEEQAPSSGLGQLRAFRPGEQRDRDWPLTLAEHRITVRIAGNVARTEIEETFHNDSAHELEGVYGFPLPADARVDRLALDVEGGFEEGAFVEKERAAGIWRGVIANAAPVEKRPTQEIVWVPGPWRDPALAEWKQGGRFELRIFPIPAGGSRTIKLAYTQVLPPFASGRRYVYPLPHSGDASARAGLFDLDLRVRGAAPGSVRARGYDLAAREGGDATHLTLSAKDFTPRGDLIVDFAPPASAELRTWTFQGDAAAAPTVTRAGRRDADPDPEVIAAQREAAADDRAYVVMSLRPELPGWNQSRPRDYILLVDSSQSMVGERYGRASRLAASLVAEMDRRDRVAVVTCDLDCRAMGERPRAPSAAAAREVQNWLATVEPAGSSDLTAAIEGALALVETEDHRDTWLIYIGDGASSVGARAPGAVAELAATRAGADGVTLGAVGIGGDADAATLEALARAGGGHYVPYVPGRRTEAAALAVLEATYGVSLREVRVELPAGVSMVAPTALPTLRAGGELLLAGRFRGSIDGELVLRGTVGGRPFVQRYPLALEPSTAAGNAFVPRLWAALTIDALELGGRAEERPRIVGLSKAYSVLSRHTSLLVLESAAMFEAFGLDRARASIEWTGEEEEIEVTESRGKVAYRRSTARSRSKADSLPEAYMAGDGGGGWSGGGMVTQDPAPMARRSGGGGGRYMRRVWFKVGSARPFDAVHPNIVAAVERFEAALREQPDSRERHRDLVQALSYAGDLDRAYEVAEAWLERDRLDPEALIYMADVLGRKGQRDRALRLLTGAVDVQPDDVRLHQRLAAAFERAGRGDRACAHRVTLAGLGEPEAATVAAALRCLRDDGARQIVSRAAPAAVRDQATRLAAAPGRGERVAGELVVEARWDAPVDLDLTVVTPEGTRLSWMGGRTSVVADQVSDRGRERLGLERISTGNYLIEVSRVGADRTPVRGTLEVEVLGTRETLELSLDGDRAVVGRIHVSRQSRLEPL
jgi:tetratricopeptide (TPR) repeat protein